MKSISEIFQSSWNETMSELTPEEHRVVMNATYDDWMNGISECVKSPDFWKYISVSFIEGMVRGFLK